MGFKTGVIVGKLTHSNLQRAAHVTAHGKTQRPEPSRIQLLRELEAERDPPLTAREMALELGCASSWRTKREKLQP